MYVAREPRCGGACVVDTLLSGLESDGRRVAVPRAAKAAELTVKQ